MTIHWAGRVGTDAIDKDGFRARAYLPGDSLPDHPDHGYGPLAAIMESFLAPGTHIPLHAHVQDEIVSWVPAGVMRHADPQAGALAIDPGHLMVMNAGRGFRHEERTHPDDPPLRMLQIFVRPRAADLEPEIQYGPLSSVPPGKWRLVFGPEGREAPFHVRNAVCAYDLRLESGASAELPRVPDWAAYVFVFEGAVRVDGVRIGQAETGLAITEAAVTLAAETDSLVIAFLIDPDAPIHRGGTVGDGETVRGLARRTWA